MEIEKIRLLTLGAYLHLPLNILFYLRQKGIYRKSCNFLKGIIHMTMKHIHFQVKYTSRGVHLGAACVLENDRGTKIMHIFMKVGDWKVRWKE